MDYKKISQDVVDHVGGISNIKGATHCVTRLSLILNDETKYDRKALENIEGVKGVLFNSGQLMIIFGTGTVNNVYDAFIELTGVKEMSQSDAKAEGMSKMGKLQQGFKVFSDIFIPIIPAFVAAAILTGVKALLTANGLFGLEGSLACRLLGVSDKAPQKKLNMFLRWMIRRDSEVDFGIWTSFSPCDLLIPLDTHVCEVAHRLHLTRSKSYTLNNAKAITRALAEVFPDDPCLGDFALFGYGINDGK